MKPKNVIISLFVWSLIVFVAVLWAGFAYAADLTLRWDASADATGYKIYQSTDSGATWDAGTDVGNVTEYTITGVPDSGLVLFRVAAYNSQGEAVRLEAGAWYNGDWKPPKAAGGLGIQ